MVSCDVTAVREILREGSEKTLWIYSYWTKVMQTIAYSRVCVKVPYLTPETSFPPRNVCNNGPESLFCSKFSLLLKGLSRGIVYTSIRYCLLYAPRVG